MLILPRRFKSQPQQPAPLDLESPVLAGVSNAIVLYGDAQAWLQNRGADSQLGSLIPNPTITGGGITDFTDIGSALEFDGTSTYLDFGSANIPASEFTLLWGGVFDANDSPRGFVDCTNNGVSGWNIYQGGGDTMYFNNSSYPAGNPSTGWTVGEFFHGALRNKGGVSADWFRNGAMVASGTGVSPAAPTLPLWIGRLKVGGLPYLKARFSYLYLVDKFLDIDTISRIPGNPGIVFRKPRRIFPFASAAAGAYILTASPGSFAITGTAAALKYSRVLPAASGSFAVSGAAATLKRGYSLQAAPGSFAISGAVAALKYSRVLPASAGAVQIGGTAASLKYNRLLSASPGSFAISGTDATLTYQTAGNRTLVADAGSFAISGAAANLRLSRRLSAGAGSFAFSGTAATLRYARKVIADAGAFAITGTAAALSKSGGAASARRTYAVPVEERIFAVPAENRIYTAKL